MAEDAELSHWKTAKAEATFRKLYTDACADVCRQLERSGAPQPRTVEVPSRFGTTRCLHWAGSGEPLVLLHGHNGSWLAWALLLAELADRDIYALDTIGEPGGSLQTQPIASVSDLVTWLGETLGNLELRRPNLIGMSYGGWIATHFAAAHPNTVSSLILLEPAIGTITMPRVLRQGMAVAATQLLPPPVRRWAARRIDAEALVFDPRLRKPTALAFRKFDRNIPTYAKLNDPTPDSTLSSIKAPTLLLLGGRSELHNVDEVAQRARNLIPHVELHIVDGASHALPVTRPKAVADIVRPFLDRHSTALLNAGAPCRRVAPLRAPLMGAGR